VIDAIAPATAATPVAVREAWMNDDDRQSPSFSGFSGRLSAPHS
jgi:hypothetical protein